MSDENLNQQGADDVIDLGLDLNEVETGTALIGRFTCRVTSIEAATWPSGERAFDIAYEIESPRTYKFSSGKEMEIVGKKLTERVSAQCQPGNEWQLGKLKKRIRAFGQPVGRSFSPKAVIGSLVEVVTKERKDEETGDVFTQVAAVYPVKAS
jgi:hypothetical protein